MAHDRDDDIDFASMMEDAGVTRFGKKGAARGKPAAPAPAAASATPSRAATPPRDDARVDALEADLLAARDARLTLEKTLAARDAELAELRDAAASHGEREADLRREIDGLKLRKKAAEAERERLAARLREAHEDRRAVAPPEPDDAAAAPVPLADLLTERGLETAAEHAAAVAALAAGESATSLLRLLDARDPDAARRLLDGRLALLCESPDCAPPQGATVLRVEPARCDICGGSDIRRAAHGFTAACVAQGVVRVRVVGGSPSYRAQLEALFPRGGPVQLMQTPGTTRVTLQRAKGHQRVDDLVIVWGATELDHATSNAYRESQGWVEIIPHRGIGGMLDQAAALIRRGRPGA